MIRNLLLGIILGFGLAACDGEGLGMRGDAGVETSQIVDGTGVDAGILVDAENPAIDSQPATVAVDSGVGTPCTATAACADGFHRLPLSDYYATINVYACGVNVGETGALVANPCGVGEIYGYRAADLVTCKCR